VQQEPVLRKAELLTAGYLYVDPAVELPGAASHSTAGPDAGERGLVFEFDGVRVRLRISDDPRAEFHLVEEDAGLSITRRGERYAQGVRFLPNIMHAPGMAFVNIESGCAMDCKFCATPHLKKESRKRIKKEEWLDRLLEVAGRGDLQSIGITAGVSGIPGKTIADIEWLIVELRKRLPAMPIGVEPYVESEEEIRRLHEAGATELKLNLQTFDRALFKRVCPHWDFNRQLELIEKAAGVFGRERVTANLIVGMGESDESVVEGLEFLVGLGIVPTVRMLRWNDINREHLEEALGGPVAPVAPERLLRLARLQQALLDRAGLSVLNYKTMCHACRACDIVPQVDFQGPS
jgi:hypothetical protein